MLKMALGLLCICLSVSPWQAASAAPWTVVTDPDPQPVATFVPAQLSELRADGYWASGIVQSQADGSTASAVGRFDANGNPERWLFDSGFANGFAKKRLPDGGFVYGSVRETTEPLSNTLRSFCMVVRVNADGRTQWQTVLDGRFCQAVEIDAAGEIWVAVSDNVIPDRSNFLNMDNRTIAQVVRLHEDGRIAARIALDTPLQRVVEMHADPAGAGVFLAVLHAETGNPQAVRTGFRRLRADGSVDWQWQSANLAAASDIPRFRVSASAGIYAISSQFKSGQTIGNAKDWLAVGLSLAGVPRFDKTIRFDNAVFVAGVSAPDAAGLWLAVAWGNRSDGARDGKVAVVRLSAAGKLGSSHKIKDAQVCACQLALRRDGGLWLLVFDQTTSIVGVDANGKERARFDGVRQGAFDLLPDDRALVVSGSPLQPVRAVRVGFNQPNESWPQLTLPVRRRFVALEAVAGDGGVARWDEMASPDGNSITATLTFRASDAAPVAWQVAFPFYGDVQLSVSRSMVCMAGPLRNRDRVNDVLECRRRSDGSVLWQDIRAALPMFGRFQMIAALDDGRAVALRGELGDLSHWLIGADGEVLSEQSQPLLGADQQELEIARASSNAQGDILLSAFDRTRHAGILLSLDRNGQERFRTAFEGVFVTYGDVTQDRLAFAGDGGAIMYGSVIARYAASGEKLWERDPESGIPGVLDLLVDLLVDGDTILYTRRMSEQFSVISQPNDWEVVAMDSASGDERWRLPLGALAPRWTVGIAPLAGRRLAVLQTEGSHLRYRELEVATGTVLREQTDVCDGELCGCEQNSCRPFGVRRGGVTRPTLQLQAVSGRLRARLDTFQVGAGWGTSVLELADAGQVPATVRADQEGVSGAWFAPWSNGQGLMLDWIADARTLFGSWLTFAPDGGNDPSGLRWYTLQGVLANPANSNSNADAVLDINSSEGGHFGDGVTAARRVGSARLRFESCNRAQFSYQFDPDENEGLSGMVTLSRLTPGVACIGGVAGDATPTVANAIEGAWFDPGSSGQGLMFNTILAPDPAQDSVFATWFTYDTEAAPDDPRQQHWFTLQGPLGSDGQGTLTIFRTIGGALIDGPTNNSQRVGTATLTRLGCDQLRLSYQFDDSGTAGPFRRIDDFRDLQRIGGCGE
ncbi:MAG: hypothetical protein CVV14_01620 [Gammaproteobacteria bacterium HGW-Gammaproteobacteria-4]|nr:MAG: hypothetical protein CVV14_01620 [Gammaproteobacteria bacterium HGW-Gammaproteobacteria-4]